MADQQQVTVKVSMPCGGSLTVPAQIAFPWEITAIHQAPMPPGGRDPIVPPFAGIGTFLRVSHDRMLDAVERGEGTLVVNMTAREYGQMADLTRVVLDPDLAARGTTIQLVVLPDDGR